MYQRLNVGGNLVEKDIIQNWKIDWIMKNQISIQQHITKNNMKYKGVFH